MRDRTLNDLIGAPLRSKVAYDALMPRKVSRLLLVSSLYDYFTFSEDGKLSEMLFSEFLDLDFRFTPSIERVSRAEEALEKLRTEDFDLVISMPRVGEMNVREFGEAVQSLRTGVPVVLLACSPRELSVLPPVDTLKGIDTLFVWLGDVRLFPAIIKHIEDGGNAWHDARAAGVRTLILVEDSVQFYSSYLPMLYTEILNQTRALVADSVSRDQKLMRMRARPKVLLARTYEEATCLYEQYREFLLGAIVDVAFPREGLVDPAAGFQLARLFREQAPDLPLLIQSDAQNAPLTASLGMNFVDKESPTLFRELRSFIQEGLGFGDFVFRGPDQAVISRVPNLRTLEWAVRSVPEEHLLDNVRRSEFRSWLVARTEFELADAVKDIVQRADAHPGGLRQQLLHALSASRERATAGVVMEYSSRTFDGASGFVRIGRGSLGGKGRGLAFINNLINTYSLKDRFPGVRIHVPAAAVLTTSVFERFMESSGLLSYALNETSDDKITAAFLEAEMPPDVLENLWNFLQWVRYPLAVRSSSLLEDASYQPFAGIYKTYMIPNSDEDPEVRLEELCAAIKSVYASTYHADPKAYMASLPNRLEEERMAVVIQQLIGRRHGSHLYPDFAGVGRSLNFYPMPGMSPEEGVVSVALGMGRTVVEGGRAVRFCPAWPRQPIQSFTPEEYVENSQQTFLALDVTPAGKGAGAPSRFELVSLGLDVAERDGTLSPIGSVYSADDDAVYDGISRKGRRLVTMAGVLKGGVFPLGEVMAFLLRFGAAASSSPVEIEFAVTLAEKPGEPHEFAFLQIRPLVVGADLEDVRLDDVDARDALCFSHKALGNGVIRGVRDVVYVRREAFDRSTTLDVAGELGAVNERLRQQRRPYLLIGPGRWGSADPWLGIPVKWAQIAGVRCIIETGFDDMQVDASQGSHFFQNIVSFGIGYLTVDPRRRDDFVDQSWLDRQPAEAETAHLRHVAFREPLPIMLDGRRNVGVVMRG